MIARRNHTVERVELDEGDLREHFTHNLHKIEIIDDKLEAATARPFTAKATGTTLPLARTCQHGDAHARAPDLGVHRLPAATKTANNSFASTAWSSPKEALKATLARLEEAKKRDHCKLGKELRLFHVDEEVGQGLILWMPRGAVIRQELQDFISHHLRRQGYSQVFTLNIGKLDSTDVGPLLLPRQPVSALGGTRPDEAAVR